MKAGLMAAAMAATISTTWAAPTLACSLAFDDTFGSITFRDKALPANAELWVTNVDEIISPEIALILVAPDGTTSPATVERDGPDGRVVVEVELAPGAWTLQLWAPDENGVSALHQEAPFELLADDDTTPPPAPVVTVERVTVGGHPLGELVEPCGPRERTTIRVISIEVRDHRDVARVMIDGVAYNQSEGFVSVATRQEDGSDVVVSVVDYAGNESEVVVAESVARGGCASVPAAPMSVLALGLLLRRRRRRGAR